MSIISADRPALQYVQPHAALPPHPLVELTWRAELPRLKRKSRQQYLAMTRVPEHCRRRFQEERQLIKFYELVHDDLATRRAELIKLTIERMQECQVSRPCELPGCPQCAGTLAREYAQSVLEAAIRHVQADPRRHSVVAITVTAADNRWNGATADIHARIESDVLECLVPFCTGNQNIVGATLHFDCNVIDDLATMMSSPDKLLLIDRADIHGHLHGQLALRDVDVSESNLETLARRWTHAINRKYPGRELDIHLESLEAEDGKFATDFAALAGWTNYSCKARTRIHNAPVTRILRGELIGAKLHWSCGIFCATVDPLAAARDEIKRVKRLYSELDGLINHLATKQQSLALLRLQQLSNRSIIMSERLAKTLAELQNLIAARAKRDRRLVYEHGGDALKLVWSDTYHDNVPARHMVNYLHDVHRLNACIVRTRRQLDELLPRLMKLSLKMLRCGLLTSFAKPPIHSISTETDATVTRTQRTAAESPVGHDTAAFGRLLDYIMLASATYEARMKLQEQYLRRQQLQHDSELSPDDIRAVDREIYLATESLQNQNDVFPGWLFSETAKDLKQRQWWLYCGRMLLA